MSSFDFFCLTFFLFPPAGYSLCRHAPSAESFACSHWSVRPRPPIVPIIRAACVWQQLASFPIDTYLLLSLFPLSLATPLPFARRFRSGSVTWPWTPSRETNPLKLTHAGPTLVRPSVLFRK